MFPPTFFCSNNGHVIEFSEVACAKAIKELHFKQRKQNEDWSIEMQMWTLIIVALTEIFSLSKAVISRLLLEEYFPNRRNSLLLGH